MKFNKQFFETMDTEKLEEAIQLAYEIIESRKEDRKKDLWGNVVGAIKKYQAEIGPISCFCRCCGEAEEIYNISEVGKIIIT